MGVAVITLRAALRRLEQNGLVESVPKWGVRIPVETPEGIRDRYFLREVLETAALARFHDTLHPVQAAQLRALADACDRMHDDTPDMADVFARAHADLHGFIAECSGSQLVSDTLVRLLTKGFMLRNAMHAWARNRGHGPGHHLQLVEALLGADAGAADAALRAHIREGLSGELDALGSH